MSHLPDPYAQSEFYSYVALKRFGAWVIDVVVITVILLIAGIFTVGLAWFFWPVFFVALSFVYRWFTLSSQSATWGMRIMAIESRNATGARLNSFEAMMHTFLFMLASGFVLPQTISVLMMILGVRKQGLHDLFLGTVAINRSQ